MISVIAAALLSSPFASDWFPLKAGSEWEYSVTFGQGLIPVTQLFLVREPVIIKGTSAIPMDVLVNGESQGTSFYGEAGGFVVVLAVKSDSLLPQPLPVLPLEVKKGKTWEHSGATMLYGGTASIKTKSKITKLEMAEVLGKKVEIMEIFTTSQIGEGPAALKTESTERYGKGIGMVYRHQRVVAKDGGTATFQLTRYTEAAQ